MDKTSLINQLKTKPILQDLVKRALDDPTMIDACFEIIGTESSGIKFASTKIIRLISEQKPELVYPYYDVVMGWFEHPNSFIKWDGIRIMANLWDVDRAVKFMPMYERYFDMIRDPQMITAANVIGQAWKLISIRPELEPDITRRLLEVPNITYLYKGEPSPECGRIVSGQVLECFGHYFDRSTQQKEMLDYAYKLLDCPRKAVSKNAERFLKRFEKQSD